MLDNFGMGEFLMLALFALLFFGPERLPQIGAQLGKWLSKLTSYSKAFMNQWTEEAAAVQGAVQDVMSIRDEIRTAQREIAETLNAAQQDINETISVAKGTIQAATPTAQGFAQGGAPALADAEDANRVQGSRGGTSGGDDSEAVSKTQDVVNSLLLKQGITPEQDADAEDKEAAESDATDEDAAYQKNLAVIQEIMESSPKTVSDREDSSTEDAPDEENEQDESAAPPTEAAQAVVTQPGAMLGSTIIGDTQAQGALKPKREETESAFDKTQAILNKLMGIEPEPEPEIEAEPEIESEEAESELEPEPEPEPAVPTEGQASESADVSVKETVDDELSAAESATATDVKTWAVQHTRGPDNGVSVSEFTKLSIEVNLLKRELKALRTELQTLHAQSPEQAESASLSGTGTTEQKGDSASAMPVEEVA